MIKNFKKILYVVFTMCVASLASFSVTTATEEVTGGAVVFPIAELGGCANRTECRTYCDDTNHMDACLNFAEKNGLMSVAEVNKAREYAKLMQDHVEFPGGAKNPSKAREYCEDSNHAKECLEFAEKYGLMDKKELDEAMKFLPILKAGETPGRCTSKQECEKYCSDTLHTDECLAFAEKHGLISAQDAVRAKQFKETGGPGGCKTESECEAYCNAPEHQEACITFAKEHGIVEPEEVENIKEGMARLRTSLMDSPELKRCLIKNLSEDDIFKIENGSFVPSSKTGKLLKACFEAMKNSLQKHAEARLNEAPPEVKACLQIEVGDEGLGMLREGGAPDPFVADKVRTCFERGANKEDPRDRSRGSFMSDPENPAASAGLGMPDEVRRCVQERLGVIDLTSADKDKLGAAAASCANQIRYARPENMDDEAARKQQEYENLRSAAESASDIPPEVEVCIKAIFGDNYKEQIMDGTLSEAVIREKVISCVPEGITPPQGMSSEYNEDMMRQYEYYQTSPVQ